MSKYEYIYTEKDRHSEPAEKIRQQIETVALLCKHSFLLDIFFFYTI